MADFDQLFVDKLDAALRWDLEKFNLGLNEEIEGKFGNEERGSRVLWSCG